LAVAFAFEDMLETQAGATIFALFYSMAVFRAPCGRNGTLNADLPSYQNL